LFFSKYKPDKKLGEGSFGKIYSAHNIQTKEKFAIKLESKNGQNLLESESYVLCYLKGFGIPFVKSYGISGDYHVLVMELLGRSLEDLFQSCGKRLSLKTVCLIGIQMLNRIEYVHSKHIIHRDIKPDNFGMGLGEDKDSVFIIDFGLAKKYRSSRTLQHICLRNNKKLTGTARYASINALKGSEQSRRDDLEAIAYVLLYLVRGSLPWQGMKVEKNEDRYKKIYERKKGTSIEELSKDLPEEFGIFVKYTRELEFEADPNYEYLRSLLKTMLDKHCVKEGNLLDWDVNSNSNSNQSTVESVDTNALNIKHNNIERVVTLSSIPRFFDDTNAAKTKHDGNQRIRSKEVVISEQKNDCTIL